MTSSVVQGFQYSTQHDMHVEKSATGADSESVPMWSTADQHVCHLPTDRYTLKVPIPIRVFETEDGAWMASFDEAAISMQGDDILEAYVSLLHDIVYAFDCLRENRNSLSAFMEWQLSILKDYIEIR